MKVENNNTFILESFRNNPGKVTVHITGGNRKLVEVKNGKEIQAVNRLKNESLFEINLQPLFYRVFRIE
jgi:hypothetical protein